MRRQSSTNSLNQRKAEYCSEGRTECVSLIDRLGRVAWADPVEKSLMYWAGF
jgi:hypothetical protein